MSRFLIQRKWLDVLDENTKLAVSCTSYLTSRPFQREATPQEVDLSASRGYYAFQDYAVKHWYDHCQEVVDSSASLTSTQCEDALTSLQTFLHSYRVSSDLENDENEEENDGITWFFERLRLKDECERNEYFNIEHRTLCIRTRLESLDVQSLDVAAREAFTSLHDTITPYKCPKPWCDLFTNGFQIIEDRNQHIDLHDRPFVCPVVDCFASTLGFDFQIKLDQHSKEHHRESDNGVNFTRVLLQEPRNLCEAAERGDLTAVKSFLDSGGNMNQTSRTNGAQTPLYFAAKHGHFHICELLLESRLHLSPPHHLALRVAVGNGETDIVRLLLQHRNFQRYESQDYCESLSLIACENGYLGIVKLLIEEGLTNISSINTPLGRLIPFTFQKTYSSALEAACKAERLAVVKYLLQEFPNISVREGVFQEILLACKTMIAEVLYPKHVEFIQTTCERTADIRKGWIATIFQDSTRNLGLKLVSRFRVRDYSNLCFSADGKHIAFIDGKVLKLTIASSGKTIFESEAVSLDQLDQAYFSTGSGSYIADTATLHGEKVILVSEAKDTNSCLCD